LRRSLRPGFLLMADSDIRRRVVGVRAAFRAGRRAPELVDDPVTLAAEAAAFDES